MSIKNPGWHGRRNDNDTMVMIPVLSNKERGCARIAIDKYTKTKPKKKQQQQQQTNKKKKHRTKWHKIQKLLL